MSIPKFSIIVPSYNGGKYLPSCIESIVNQNYTNYEVILSDDHSTDETINYLNTISHPKVKIVYPPTGLSMAEHWEWALSNANGEWIMFVGQDDGLQPYFFSLADKLTKLAANKKIRTIMSRRAYFFWPGCQAVYGDTHVSYNAVEKISTKNSKFEVLRTLLGFQNYFELPEMYTTSVFHKEILSEAKDKQNGKLFLAHPQDANLAAIACSLDRRYLKSEIPLGWVGTSPKSAGMALSVKNSDDFEGKEELNKLRVEYEQKINRSEVNYNPLAGDFSFGSVIIYFWQALLQTKHLRNGFINLIIESKAFKTLMFGRVLVEMQNSEIITNESFMPEFERIISLNKCNMKRVLTCSKLRIPRNANRALQFIQKIHRKIYKSKIDCISYYVSYMDSNYISMTDASKAIVNMIKESKQIKILT
jgi:glycosyltransferase involved in cell wall biosynthesis